MIITKTPYRLSLFGGGTDYPAWFHENGGIVIAAGMARYCYISLRKLPPFFEHKTRAVYSIIESVRSNMEIKHPSIQACLQYLDMPDGLEIHHDGDLPARSGIGSSSSFTVGLLHALHALRFEMVTKKDLAQEAIFVEQDLIGESVGVQDQIMAAYGGVQTIELGPGPEFVVRQLIMEPDYLRAFEDHFLLGYTGVSRTAEEFAKSQVENIRREKTAKPLSEIRDIARQALNVLKNQGNLEDVGKLLHENWLLKRGLAKGVTTNLVDDLYSSAIKAGAIGGKLMGAGGGGFMMFFAPPYRHEAIKNALKSIKVWVPFSIDSMGSQVIFHDGTKYSKDRDIGSFQRHSSENRNSTVSQ